MRPRIQILPESLANQIAAGEVVERPASVVKELLENSLDAGATEIFIDVEKGGKKLIRVSDNGHGMSRDDAFLCLERHATSKIRSADELFNLHTMGFRGEAVPAIASVSRFRLTTRSVDEEMGWQIYAEGGNVRQADAVGTPTGTIVEVRDLFFNTPGRRKFLRKDETEFGHLADVVTRLALSRPDVHFRLNHGERTYLEAYRHQRLEERAAALLGRSIAAEMLPVEAESGTGELLTGLVGGPTLNRSSSSHVYTYVNGRFIRDRVVQHAILEAYRTLLEKRRYPITLLFLELPAQMVDVNVHPTKHEVRFRDQRLVHDFIVATVRKCLLDSAAVQTEAATIVNREPQPLTSSPQPASSARDAEPPRAQVQLRIQESLSNYGRRQDQTVGQGAVSSTKGQAFSFPHKEVSAETAEAESWRLLGQIFNGYLVCQDQDELLLVDQHAAHERIGFERLKQQFNTQGVERQDLMFPVVVELDHREAAVANEHSEVFDQFGIAIESFGGRSFSITSVPSVLVDADVERLVRDVISELDAMGSSDLLSERIDQFLMLLACHGMVRANQALTHAEMEALLRDLFRVDFASHCPHGRPVVKRISRKELERMFHRT